MYHELSCWMSRIWSSHGELKGHARLDTPKLEHGFDVVKKRGERTGR